jgi:4-diphosphocytidyl-2-C-methyl-D-erythritol kinase
MEIELKCFAKVNLSLDITGLQDNGFHNLDMIMTNIDLFDLVRVVSREDKTINIFCDLNIPKEKNSAYLIAEKFINKFNTNGADIYINKKIPLSGGLGGSSADAAGVVTALCKINNIDIKKTFDIVNSVGSDIWYLIKGGMQRAKGKGEILTPIEYKEFYFVLAKPENGVNTSLCFKKYDELKKIEIKNLELKNYVIKVKGNIDEIIERIVNGQIFKGYLFNVCPYIGRII